MKTLDPTFKGAVDRSSDAILRFNKNNRRNQTLKVLETPLLVSPIVIYLRKNSYLTEALNEKLNLLNSNGIIGYWINNYLESKYLNVKEEAQGPQAMKISVLSGVYIALAIGLTMSCFAFLVEFLTFKFL